MRRDERTDDAYRNLASAVVIAAITDWRILCRKKAKNRAFAKLRQFFQSDWCATLCGNVDPLDILKTLEQERVQALVN